MDLKLSFVLNDGIIFDEYDTKIFTGNKHGRSKAVVLLLLTVCLLLLPLWESVIVLWFVARCFVSVLVLQSS